MKKTLAGFIAVMVLFLGFVGTSTVEADTKGDVDVRHDTLSDIGTELRDEVRAVMDHYKEFNNANKQLKEAGASYQNALTADTGKANTYTTMEQQSVMVGVYTFDATYAALFLRKKELADVLSVRKSLAEKIGFGMPLTPKMKEIVANPDKIADFDEWSKALDEVSMEMVVNHVTTDKRLDMLVDAFFGAVVEGMYVVTESIAQAGYPQPMLDLMNQQHDRIDFMLKLLNVFRGDKAFENEVEFDERFDVLGDIHNLLLVRQFTQREVDGIRQIIAPLRQDILDGTVF